MCVINLFGKHFNFESRLEDIHDRGKSLTTTTSIKNKKYAPINLIESFVGMVPQEIHVQRNLEKSCYQQIRCSHFKRLFLSRSVRGQANKLCRELLSYRIEIPPLSDIDPFSQSDWWELYLKSNRIEVD